MQLISLTLASSLKTYTDFLSERGAKVDHGLRLHQLPTSLDNFYEAVVPAPNVIRFVEHMEKQEGIDDLDFQVSHGNTGFDITRSMLMPELRCPTLSGRLQQYFQLVRNLNSSSHLSLRVKGNHAWILISSALSDKTSDMRSRVEWILVNQVISVIRDVLGSEWTPEEINMRDSITPCKEAADQYDGARIHFRQQLTSIRIPLNLLYAPVMHSRGIPLRIHRPKLAYAINNRETLSFVDKLKLLLQAYIGERNLSVDFIAMIIETSVRTLQRSLNEHGLNYTALVQDVRFQVAKMLLLDTREKMIEVSFAVGYDDPSHFARAFRHWSGESPLEFRKDNKPVFIN